MATETNAQKGNALETFAGLGWITIQQAERRLGQQRDAEQALSN